MPKDTRRRRNPKNEIKHQPMPEEPVDDDRFYVIEKILDKRLNALEEEEYLVRWQNYPPEWDSWEPRKELERNALDMINEFNRLNHSDNSSDLHCFCKRPYRFEQGGMIQCFYCLVWYHFTCLKMDMEEANNYARYYCRQCTKINPRLRSQVKQEKLKTFYGMSLSQTLSQMSE